MNGWDAFRVGLSRALRYRWVLLILFAVNLASALLLAVLPALSLSGGLGHRPAIRQAADGVDAWLVIETMMSAFSEMALGEGGPQPESMRGLQQATLLGLLMVAVLAVLAWLPATFLTGGVLLTYAESPQPFGWRRFLWGCWHWLGAFLLLSVVQGAASVVVLVPVTVAVVVAVAAGSRWLTWIVVPLLALVAVLWLALMECTRVIAVVGEMRNIARAFGKAVRFVFRWPLPVAGLYGLTLLLLALLHGLYRWGMMPHLPLDWWPLVLLVQQTFILARLWARLVRLTGGVALCQELVD